MKHCTPELLARLVDELPDAETRAHLDHCATCRVQLDALRKQTESLAGLPLPAVPRDSWRRIADQLAHSNGHAPSTAMFQSRIGRWRTPAWTRAAAALLFLAGAA